MHDTSLAQKLISRPFETIVDYYSRHLSAGAHAFLKSQCLSAAATLRVGFSDRTLGTQLPGLRVKIGREVRSTLKRLGVTKANGRESLRGFITVPLTDIEGSVSGLFGLRVDNKGKEQPQLTLGSGLFNAIALREFDELIVCAHVLDAWTFHAAGYTNVVASAGQSFEPEQFARAKRVLLADSDIDPTLFDNTGRAELLRLHFPEGVSANEYARLNRNTEDALGKRIRSATLIDVPKATTQDEPAAPQASSQPIASPSPEPARDFEITQSETEITLRTESRRWRVMGLDRNMTAGVMRINLLVFNERNERFHVDTLDLYHSRSRRVYLKEACEETALSEHTLRSDLGRVLLALEELQQQNASAQAEKAVELSDSERAVAMELLTCDHLFERILSDFDACGLVGERTGKLVGYLAATSRLLERPLGLMIQSSSAAGKTSLMNAILAFMPEEKQLACSAMTGQSLYYAGNLDLRHKILAVAEGEGVGNASYALKLLQSEGQLSIMTTVKESGSGRTTVERYQVDGPVAMLLTTTASNVDVELMNRFFVLSVDENAEQTEAIQASQRRSQTPQSLAIRERAQQIRTLHQNAQRLLQPLRVVNPFADQLTFATSRVRDRRDNAAYLSLIAAIALLHQFARKRERRSIDGKEVDVIEVQRSDISLANKIVGEILGASIDDLPAQTRRLLLQIFDYLSAQAKQVELPIEEHRFTRRKLREALCLGQTQLKIHLDRLREYEYVRVHPGPGRTQTYSLRWDGSGREGQPTLFGLTDPATLREPVTMTPHHRG